jgi:hypothetical protein
LNIFHLDPKEDEAMDISPGILAQPVSEQVTVSHSEVCVFECFSKQNYFSLQVGGFVFIGK